MFFMLNEIKVVSVSLPLAQVFDRSDIMSVIEAHQNSAVMSQGYLRHHKGRTMTGPPSSIL